MKDNHVVLLATGFNGEVGITTVCGACGESAEFRNTAHNSLGGGKAGGCNAYFTHSAILATFRGESLPYDVRNNRPDLPFLGWGKLTKIGDAYRFDLVEAAS